MEPSRIAARSMNSRQWDKFLSAVLCSRKAPGNITLHLDSCLLASSLLVRAAGLPVPPVCSPRLA
eukprot:2829968-Rhodomonas_salina.3